MNDTDYIPAFDFQSRENLIALRKQKLAQLMREMEATGRMPRPSGEMISGRYVRAPWTEHLARALKPRFQQANINAEQAGLEKDLGEYNAADRRAAIEHAMSRPQGRPELAGPIDEGNPNELQARPVDTRDMVEWAQKGSAIPSRRDVVAKIINDLEVNAPVRKEEQTYKSTEAAQARADRAAEAERARLERGEQAAKDREVNDARARDLARQRSEDMRYTTDQNNETRRALIAAGLTKAENKPLSDRARSDLDAAEAASQGIDQAAGAIAGASGKGTGYLAGLAQEFLPGGSTLVSMIRDTPTKDAIQKLTYVTDEIRHGRFGASLTKGEKESAAQYLPSAYDDKAELQRKAEGLQGLLALSNRRLKEQGARTGSVSGTWGAPSTAPVRVSTPAAAARLPKGTRFVTPDGQERVRQ